MPDRQPRQPDPFAVGFIGTVTTNHTATLWQAQREEAEQARLAEQLPPESRPATEDRREKQPRPTRPKLRVVLPKAVQPPKPEPPAERPKPPAPRPAPTPSPRPRPPAPRQQTEPVRITAEEVRLARRQLARLDALAKQLEHW